MVVRMASRPGKSRIKGDGEGELVYIRVNSLLDVPAVGLQLLPYDYFSLEYTCSFANLSPHGSMLVQGANSVSDECEQ